MVWDHRLDHNFPQPVTSLISHRVVVSFAIVWCPIRLSISPRCLRSYSMYVPSNLYRLILVSLSWARFLRLFHILQNRTQVLIQVIAQYPPLPPPSPSFPTISWATGLRSTHDHFPPLHHQFTSVTLCLFIAPYCTYH